MAEKPTRKSLFDLGNVFVRLRSKDEASLIHKRLFTSQTNAVLEERLRVIALLDPRLKQRSDVKAERVTQAMKTANIKTHLFRPS